MIKHNPLTPEEKRVIEEAGTEPPFTGVYDNFYQDGAYLCWRCDNYLFDAKAKFEAGCGWPSFDREAPGAVKRRLDKDDRTEIICAECEAHLGHVFEGERLTSQNTRHCANSLSLRFVPRDFQGTQKPQAVLAGGCFWCLEAVFKNIKGVLSVVPGYTGGWLAEPTYEQVSHGETGHCEAVVIDYDPELISYEEILKIFFIIHDPTTLNRQGNDIGEQYRSAVYYLTWNQKISAQMTIKALEEDKVFKDKIVTEVKPLIKFYPAESHHCNYFEQHPEQAYCQIVIAPKLKKLRYELFDKYSV